MSTRLEAHYDDRIYYFILVDRTPQRITIEMYKATYVFVPEDGKWVNYFGNQLQMTDGLIAAVINAIQ
jgi:hypothetical protein